jgi:hypothetical protein
MFSLPQQYVSIIQGDGSIKKTKEHKSRYKMNKILQSSPNEKKPSGNSLNKKLSCFTNSIFNKCAKNF